VSSLDPAQALVASTRVIYEVYVDGRSTGRKFTSIPSAQRYANAVQGEVRISG
jgi:hypothetical protein